MQFQSMHLNDSDSEGLQIGCQTWLPRRRSNDSLFGELINPPYNQNRNLILDYEHLTAEREKPKLFKPKPKSIKIKKACDYRKNICGYITKKIIREYLSSTYRPIVQQLCQKYGCSYDASKSHFLARIERITGPSHVPSLFLPANSAETAIKLAFKQFFVWFTRERYLRYLLLEGKMEQKEAYIQYKNTVLMSLVNNPISIDSSSGDSNGESNLQ